MVSTNSFLATAFAKASATTWDPKQHVFHIHAPSHSFLKNHGVLTQPQICQRGLANQGQAGIWPQVTTYQLHSIPEMRYPGELGQSPGHTCPCSPGAPL